MAEHDGKVGPRFSSWAKRVHRRLFAGRMLAGATVGLLLGGGMAGLAWYLRLGALRPLAGLLGFAGAAAGALLAQRKRWSDEAVALYLDKHLSSDEAIATAIELERFDDPPAAYARVAEQAHEALSGDAPKGMWPRVVRGWHALAPVGAAAIVWLSVIGLPAAPALPPAAPGSEMITLEDPKGLEKVIQLSQLDPSDEAQRKRLQELSERAKKLRQKLRQGMPKREAQAELAKLREDVAAERQRFGSGEQRGGLEAALSKMAANRNLKQAAKALGDRDLNGFDEEMEKLANKLEEQDRDAAKEALEEAAKAAREAGAPDVAKSLEEQRKLMEQRAKRAEMLKQLADAMGDGLSDDAKDALRQMQQNGGSQGDMQKLSEELSKALEQLSDEERKKLAENMKKMAQQQGQSGNPNMGPMSQEQLEQMRKQLSTEEGRKQLAEQLKKMANAQPPTSQDGERQRQLGDAQRGLDDAQRQLGTPMPSPGQGQPGQGQAGQGQPGQGQPGQQPGQGAGQSGDDKGKGQAGPSRGGGPGDHSGTTDPVTGDSIRSRANAKLNPGAPNPGTTQGRAPGREGETANQRGTGQLGAAAPSEIGAAERSEVPEEYREQVGRYFQPR